MLREAFAVLKIVILQYLSVVWNIETNQKTNGKKFHIKEKKIMANIGKYIFFVYKYSKFNTKVQGSEKNFKTKSLDFPQFHQNIDFI